MEKVYFISDAHLGLGSREEERAKEDRLLAFLDQIKRDASELFIVGDLFDAWFEYRTVIPKGYHRTLSKLEELSRSGISIHFLVGNHDCWIRDYFHQELGLRIYRTGFALTLHGKKIYLHHGDGLANNDTGYTILKKILRNRFAVWLYSWLHPDVGLRLARASSRTSRQHTAAKHYGDEDGMTAFAKARILEGCDIVIMGHHHQTVVKTIAAGAGRSGTYINLGDWITHNTYAELAGDGRIELKHWQDG
jgi:UDP-2,3-diacylglucosamine hydrolase